MTILRGFPHNKTQKEIRRGGKRTIFILLLLAIELKEESDFNVKLSKLY